MARVKRYHIRLGDKTTHGGEVISAWGQDCPSNKAALNGIPFACIGDKATCPQCKGVFEIIPGDNVGHRPRVSGRLIASTADFLTCGAQLLASQSVHSYTGDSEQSQGAQPASALAGVPAGGAQSLTEQTDKNSGLEYRITLKDGGNRILTPLAIPDFAELPSGSTKNKEIIDFEINNKKAPADSVLIEVLTGDKVIFTETKTDAFLSSGKHDWQWDGYDSNGILDTAVLKHKPLRVRLTATQNGNKRITELWLKNEADQVDWLDARVDRNSKKIEVTVRPKFTDGGCSGDPIPGYTAKTFEQLKAMAKNGIEKYWARDGSRGINAPIQTASGTFSVTVAADVNVEPSAEEFRLIELLRKPWSWWIFRPDSSTSIGPFSKIIHQAGDWNNRREGILEADPDFECAAAHEFGQRIMGAYGNIAYSWTHNHSSTEISQQPLPGTSYPATGEIDLMKYADIRPSERERRSRSVASVQDVRSLLWLARVEFNG